MLDACSRWLRLDFLKQNPDHKRTRSLRDLTHSYLFSDNPVPVVMHAAMSSSFEIWSVCSVFHSSTFTVTAFEKAPLKYARGMRYGGLG